MEKIWLAEYPGYVPKEINEDSQGTVIDIFEKSVAKYGDNIAFSNFGSSITYAELDKLSRSFAAYIQNELKLLTGERMAIMLPNIFQYPVVLFAAMRLGIIIVNINPLYTARELEYQLIDSGAKALVILSSATPLLVDIVERTSVEHIIVTDIGDLVAADLPVTEVDKRLDQWLAFDKLLQLGSDLKLQAASINKEDILFLQYTGGTTGISKGAMLTHRNIVANIEQINVYLAPVFTSGEDVIIAALPLYHIFGLTVSCLHCISIGAMNVLITNPQDFEGFVKELGRWKFTSIAGVNTLFTGLLNTEGFEKLDFSNLKLSIGGGMPVLKTIADRWQSVTGCMMLQGYGLSETSPAVSLTPISQQGFDGSIGLPVPSTEISLRNEYGSEVGIDEPGELCVKGPQVTKGYWQKPEVTGAAFTEDGFFKTGDIAIVNKKGVFYLIDRKKDVIIVSGFNVYPNEVEDVVSQCPGVLECACIGVPDEKCGELVKVFVVRAQQDAVDVDGIIEFCRSRLARYKIPRSVEFVDKLPKSTVGKILRRELRKLDEGRS